ncbi:hypothetical protein ACHAXN_012358 [Cyclotella atomus]|jgi:FKBP-type peptidyl-prolyl cis-trans isomerase
MISCRALSFFWALSSSLVHGFSRDGGIRATTTNLAAAHRVNESESAVDASTIPRRRALQKAVSLVTTAAASSLIEPLPAIADIEGVVTVPQSSTAESSAQSVDGKSVTVFKTKSGLQYIDLVEGSGPSPRYGNFVSISYKGYVKLPDIKGKSSQFDQFDADPAYLVKHGNGRTVPGLDEGIHTMKVGGKRRIIIPPKLGYVTSGLGPVPPGPYGRWKLNRLLDKMIEVKGGNVIFDVEMRSVIEDEADQGYYDDDSLSPDDFNTLRNNLESSRAAGGNV